MKIDINTKMITLLGKPLGQSFAARMQNAGYEAAGLNMLYFYTEVDKDHLGDVVNGLRYMNFAGFAVTKPNKVRVLRYLDELDPLCKKMGASNTVVKTPEGKLIGYNTDGVGFYTSLVEEGKINVEESTFFASVPAAPGRAMCSVRPITEPRRSTSPTSMSPALSPWSWTSTRTLPLWLSWSTTATTPRSLSATWL